MPTEPKAGLFGPISTKVPHMLHGGDYNPDQWLDSPRILKEDVRLMKLSGCNAMSVGIFAWTALEPEEGNYTFDWLDRVMDDLAAAGIHVVLATPTGARPAWMSAKYPEVLRVSEDRVRNLHGKRHNHCFTSPVYREKAGEINSRLAERYGDHEALILWHVSNEYGGACHCGLCQEAFRTWLRGRYSDDLDSLNRAWWTGFWSHTYTSWDQIESPSSRGENLVHGQNLDWRRFVTFQTIDFMQAEAEPLRRITPNVPLTTNFMWMYDGLDYFKFKDIVDVVSWDSYPGWHGAGTVAQGEGHWDPQGRDYRLAADVAFWHNLNRSIKGGKPFMLMESTPSVTNWTAVAKLKRPGMHVLSSLLAVAHGSDTVQYFQWRKSRGSSEKLHGAVVDHAGHEHTRVFREVARVGELLGKLDPVVGSAVPSQTAIIYDWENRWAVNDAYGPRNDGRKAYEETVLAHYYPLWRRGIPTDVVDSEQDLSQYRLVIAPMLYMIKPGVAEKLAELVRRGGTLVVTYWSGIADEHDLCFLGGFPGPLRALLGVWNEEIDALYPDERNAMRFTPGNALGMYGRYEVRELCELIHAESASTLATYESDFYAGRPALTVNKVAKGEAYYLAARAEDRLLDDLTGMLVARVGVEAALDAELPEGVSAQVRVKNGRRFTFVMNFQAHGTTVPVPGSHTDLLTGASVTGSLELGPYGVAVLA